MELAIKRGANGYRIGDSHHRSEFTDHEVELMRQLRDAGHKLCEIAEWFGTHKGYVSRLCNFERRRGR